MHKCFAYTVCQRSLDYMKWVKISWTCSSKANVCVGVSKTKVCKK